MFKCISSSKLDVRTDMELDVLKFWKDHQVFMKSCKLHARAERSMFPMKAPQPQMEGRGFIMGWPAPLRFFPRYKIMHGYDLIRRRRLGYPRFNG